MIPFDKMQELKEIRKQIQKCKLCDLRKHYNKPVACAGSPIAKIMFIGEAPGADEVEQGKPFVGQSGKLLRKAIIDANIDLENVFITNVISCRPLNNSFPSEQKYIDMCKNWVYKQMLFIKPKIIISVGSQAHKYIRESSEGITKVCGKWEYYDFNLKQQGNYEAWYMPTLHPSFCLRGADNRYNNPVMQLDQSGKENLLREHIASIVPKLKEISNVTQR